MKSIAIAFTQGLFLGWGLIVAIGAQNAFVLRQGLKREHVGSVVLFCALADAILMAAGVFGMAQALGEHPEYARVLALLGAAFLGVYGWRAFERALHAQQWQAEPAGGASAWWVVVSQAAAFTLLNPHVYLDTVLLVGGLGAQQPPGLQPWFVAGASLASLSWFALLGFGARWASPIFAKPMSWRILDGLIGLTMWTLTALLVRQVWAGWVF